MTVKELARTREYDKVEPAYPWNGFQVFHVWRSSEEGARLGPAKYILQKGKIVRFADLSELGMIRKEQQARRRAL